MADFDCETNNKWTHQYLLVIILPMCNIPAHRLLHNLERIPITVTAPAYVSEGWVNHILSCSLPRSDWTTNMFHKVNLATFFHDDVNFLYSRFDIRDFTKNLQRKIKESSII